MCGFSQKNCACLCTVDRLNGSYISENKNDFKYGKGVHSIYTTNRTTFKIVCVKINVKEAYLYGAYYEQLISRRSGMEPVNEGSHSFTCDPHVYPQVE